jgi:hypothetical protein
VVEYDQENEGGLSNCRFLGLEFGDKVQDGNTIWDFKEALKEHGVERQLFDMFNAMLEEQGIITHRGTIVDATFVTVPKRHTTKKDNEHLKADEELEDGDFGLDFEPDTFGHCAQVPEILRTVGVKYYYHCRGYDGHSLYKWEAPSGSRITVFRFAKNWREMRYNAGTN